MAIQEISAFSNFSGTNEQGYVIVGGSNGVEGGKKLLSDVIPVVPEQVQANWTENDDSEPSFIANKPFDKVDGSGGLDIIKGGLVVQIDKTTIKRRDVGTLYVANPVPTPSANHADVGKVLTVQQASDPNNPDEIVWAAPQGGTSLPNTTTANAGDVLTLDSNKNLSWSAPAGGGSSYTKTTVTPGESYDSGRSSSIAEGYPYDGYTLYDQEVNITNNTYSILSTTIGYYPEYYDEGHEYDSDYWHPSHALDTLIINLDANTEFPMAVVEFAVDSDVHASVNKIKVKVGNRILTRMYDAPHFDDYPLINNDTIEFGEFEEHAATQGMPKYWEIGNIDYYNKSSSYFALTNSSKVQVHIFGNCFKVITNGIVGIPAAS